MNKKISSSSSSVEMLVSRKTYPHFHTTYEELELKPYFF